MAADWRRCGLRRSSPRISNGFLRRPRSEDLTPQKVSEAVILPEVPNNDQIPKTPEETPKKVPEREIPVEVPDEEEVLETAETGRPPPPHYFHERWEEGMTPEDHVKAKERERENEKERSERLKRSFNYEGFQRFVNPWVHEFFNDPVFEFVVLPLQSKGVSRENSYFFGLAFIFLVYASVSFLLHKICILLPLGLHASLIYIGRGQGLPILVLSVWFFNMARKFVSPKANPDDIYATMHIPSYDPSLPGRSCDLGFYFVMACVLVVSYFVYSTSYGSQIQGVWICVFAMILLRNIPGFGANSMGLIFAAFFFLIAFMASPFAIANFTKTAQLILTPSNRDAILPPIPVQYAGWSLSSVLRLGVSKYSFFDTLRYIIGYIPACWAIIDDFLGPGYAVAATVEIASKRETKVGLAAITTGTWWFAMMIQIIFYIYLQEMYAVLCILISFVTTLYFWNAYGKNLWMSRGQSVMLTNARSNFDWFFGTKPGGVRMTVLQLCTLLSAAVLLGSNPGNVSAACLILTAVSVRSERYLTMLSGFITMNIPLICSGFFEVKPLTKSLNDNACDAYNVVDNISG